jgi:hypothetical protein
MTLGTIQSPLSDVRSAESPSFSSRVTRVNQARTIALTVLLVTIPLSLATQFTMGRLFPPIGLTNAVVSAIVVGIVAARGQSTWPTYLLAIWPALFFVIESPVLGLHFAGGDARYIANSVVWAFALLAGCLAIVSARKRAR